MTNDVLSLIAETDQAREAAKTWMRETPQEVRLFIEKTIIEAQSILSASLKLDELGQPVDAQQYQMLVTMSFARLGFMQTLVEMCNEQSMPDLS